MAEISEDLSVAPKIFLVLPGPEWVPDSFLETAFLSGYECYSLPSSQSHDVRQKVRIVMESFSEVILFFFLPKHEAVETWVDYLTELQRVHGNTVRIGVFYDKPPIPTVDQQIQRSFLFDVGIAAGCVGLEGTAQEAQDLLLNVFAANQAEGRRKVIRMPTDARFAVNFLVEQINSQARMLDLSVSHFTIQFDTIDPGWQIGTKIPGIRLHLGGLAVKVNALVSLKRVIKGNLVFVFQFYTDGNHGELLNSMVNKIICQHFQSKTMGWLRERFRRELTVRKHA